LSAAYSIVRKRNLTLHRVKKTAQAWKIISFAGIKLRLHPVELQNPRKVNEPLSSFLASDKLRGIN